MVKEEFKPTAVIGLTNTMSLMLDVKYEDGDNYVYSAFNVIDSGIDKVTKALVHYNTYGHAYFTKHRQRYYLNDAMKII